MDDGNLCQLLKAEATLQRCRHGRAVLAGELEMAAQRIAALDARVKELEAALAGLGAKAL